mgnify:CR=1 FL=1
MILFRKSGQTVPPLAMNLFRVSVSSVLFLLTLTTIYVKPLLFFYLGYGKVLRPSELGLIFLTSQVLLAFQLTPSGVGTLDGGMLGVFSLIHLKAATCMAFLLITRFWDLLIVGFGALYGARVGAGMLTGEGRPTGEDVGLPSDEPVDDDKDGDLDEDGPDDLNGDGLITQQERQAGRQASIPESGPWRISSVSRMTS